MPAPAAERPHITSHPGSVDMHIVLRDFEDTQPMPEPTMRQVSAFAADLRLALKERDVALQEAARAERSRDKFLLEASRQLQTPVSALVALARSLEGGVATAAPGSLTTLAGLAEHLQTVVEAMTRRAQRREGAAEAPGPGARAADLEQMTLRLAREFWACAQAKGQPLRVLSRGDAGEHIWPVDIAPLTELLRLLLDNAVRHAGPEEICVLLQFGGDNGLASADASLHLIDADPGALDTDFAPLRRDAAAADPTLAPRGVGLFRARALADELGCSIEVFKMPDRGTRVAVHLPPCLGSAADAGLSGIFDTGAHLVRLNKSVFELQRAQARADDALQQAQLDGLLRLVAAAELKDDDTGVHIVRMGWFSALIARSLGQPARYCETLLVASRMHDVGKIGVPDSILQKRGPLTADEWSVMRRHPEIGATLLRGTQHPTYDMAADVALSHHEKFDGSGYPSGLAGEAIPLAARIVALADFFDAVTMDRCYRPAMSDERAYELIREGSGKHFDPQVVEAFFRAVPGLLDVRARVNRGETISL